MAEYIVNGYKRLFEVRILHHYWLDEGSTPFDLIGDPVKREQRLLSYDVRGFLDIAPTSTTARVLKGLRCMYRNTALGLMVGAPHDSIIATDTTFEFVITVKSAAFFNYTALTLRPQTIYNLYHQPEDKTYRYKANVPVLSNASGAARGTGLTKTLYLSAEIPALAADDRVEALVQSGAALAQLTSDQPGAGTQSVASGAPANSLPVFVHQGDAPLIVPPAGLVGAPARGIVLSQDIPNTTFALIRLSAVRASDSDFSFIDAGGHAKTLAPVFQIRFKNRSTLWQYRNKRTGANTTVEPNPLPLTYFGNAGTKQKPSEGLVKAVISGTRITQLVSEIFECPSLVIAHL